MWNFVDCCIGGQFVHPSVPEEMILENLISNFIDNLLKGGVPSRHQLQMYYDKKDSIKAYLQTSLSDDCEKYELSLNQSLKDNFIGKTIKEFPIIIVSLM
eukprot:GHVL01032276.1.p1 GENE.GHVL01032276.1~~GHVL01032276.1.p1  ORF type:complete len:100 (+),score=12.40 GHVL01032276.1:544-843(+)